MDLNSFILEYKEFLSKYDIDNFKKSQSIIFEGVLSNDIFNKINPEIYFRYIDNAMSNFNSTLENVEVLDKFYTMIYKSAYIDGKNITLPIKDSSSIKKIRPEYMNIFAKDYNQNVQKIVNNNIDISVLKSRYLSGMYEDNMKNQIINTTDKIVDPRGFIVSEEPAIVRIDTYYIQHNIIPFIRSYKQIYTDLNKTANNIKTNITYVYSEINTVNSALQNVTTSMDPKTLNLLTTYKYNAIRQFMNIAAYTTSMFIRKVSAITHNMMQFMNLYNTIYNYFPEGELILHEAVIDGDISDIGDTDLFSSMVENNFDIIIPHIQSCIGKKKMELANIVSKKYNYRLNYNKDLNSEEYPYDVYSYAALNKTIANIIENLHKFEINSRDDNMIVDEILEKSGLSESFSAKYVDQLANFASLDYYTLSKYNNDMDAFLALFNDLNHFEKNVKIISINVSKCYNYIKELVNKYKDNTDQLEINKYNEIKSILDQIMRNYKDYALLVAKKIIERLDTITDYVDENSIDTTDWDLSSPEPYQPYNYNNIVELEAYNDIIENEKKIFEKLILKYESAKALKQRGVKYIYEAEDVPADENNKSGVTGVKTNQQNNGQNNDENGSIGKDLGDIISKFKAIIEKILNKFRQAVDGFLKRDSKSIEACRAKVDSLDVSNMTIQVVKFDGVTTNQLTKDIGEVINIVSGINASNIPDALKKQKTEAENFITSNKFSKIAQKDLSFKERIIKYYMNGDDGKETLRKFSGEECKEKLKNIIDYISDYKNMSDTVTKSLEDLTEKAATAQKAIVDSGKAKEENAKQQEQQNGQNTDENNKNVNVGSVITDVCKTYEATVLTVMEKKYNEYLKILQVIFPNETKSTKAKNEHTNETNEDIDNK